jgi:lysozyme
MLSFQLKYGMSGKFTTATATRQISIFLHKNFIQICPMYIAHRKKTYIKEAITFLAFACIATYLSFSWYYSSVAGEPVNDTYSEFGIAIPGSYSIHGIDISKYQQSVRWEAVKQMKVNDVQLGFVFIKATQGTDRTDNTYSINWKQAKEASIARGAYHFYNPTQRGKLQARHFIKTVKLESGDLPPVLDIEVTKGVSIKKLKKELKIWLKEVEDHFKVKPLIYTNAGFYNNILGNDFDAYPLWVAHYNEVEQPAVKRNWLFWQHSDKGRVNGIAAAVDFNVFNGDSTAFKALLLTENCK